MKWFVALLVGAVSLTASLAAWGQVNDRTVRRPQSVAPPRDEAIVSAIIGRADQLEEEGNVTEAERVLLDYVNSGESEKFPRVEHLALMRLSDLSAPRTYVERRIGRATERIDLAIRYGESALSIEVVAISQIPPHVRRSLREQLSEMYEARSLVSGREQDMRRAVDLLRQAIETAPERSPGDLQRYIRMNARITRLGVRLNDYGMVEQAMQRARPRVAAYHSRMLSFSRQGAQEGPLFANGAYARLKQGGAAQGLAALIEGQQAYVGVFPMDPEGSSLRAAYFVARRAYEDLHDANPESGDTLSRFVAMEDAEEQLLSYRLAHAKANASEWSSRIRSLLPSGGVLAVPLAGETSGAIIFVTRNHVWHVDAPNLNQPNIEEFIGWPVHLRGASGYLNQISQIYRSEERSLEPVALTLGRMLGADFWREITRLRASGAQALTWVPQGELSALPISMARPAHASTPLAEVLPVETVPVFAFLSAGSNQGATAPWALGIISDFASDLEGVSVEESLLSQGVWQGKLLQLDTTQPSASAFGSLEDLNVWHFAGHGKFDWQNTLRSGISLGSTKLRSLDILSEQRIGAFLVVLAACETGFPESTHDPYQGRSLPRDFLQAGARHVLASYWPVDDVSAALLVAKFYDELHESGRPAEALAKAQLWMRAATRLQIADYLDEKMANLPEEGIATVAAFAQRFADGELDQQPYKDPYHWAAFGIYSRH